MAFIALISWAQSEFLLSLEIQNIRCGAATLHLLLHSELHTLEEEQERAQMQNVPLKPYR